MVVALWYRVSGWLERLRLLRGRFKGKGAVGGFESISGCGLARDHTPRLGLRKALVAQKGIGQRSLFRRMRTATMVRMTMGMKVTRKSRAMFSWSWWLK